MHKVICKIRGKILYLLKIFLTNLMFKCRFGHLGHNCIIDPRLTMLVNSKYISIGNKVNILYGLRLEALKNESTGNNAIIEIGNNCSIGTFLHIGAIKEVKLGNGVLIASNVFITDHDHIYDNTKIPINCQGVRSKGKVIIEDNVWVGNNVAVLAGVQIGKNSVIGSNSVVNKNIPPNCVAAGVPAKIIKYIDENKNE